jgi:hypothetical protein
METTSESTATGFSLEFDTPRLTENEEFPIF